MLTAKGEESDRVRGLETGADDYIVKAVFTGRTDGADQSGAPPRASRTGRSTPLNTQTSAMDLETHRVMRGAAQPSSLGPTEFRLTSHSLLEKPGRVFSREQLLDTVSGAAIFMSSFAPWMCISAGCAKP